MSCLAQLIMWSTATVLKGVKLVAFLFCGISNQIMQFIHPWIVCLCLRFEAPSSRLEPGGISGVFHSILNFDSKLLVKSKFNYKNFWILLWIGISQSYLLYLEAKRRSQICITGEWSSSEAIHNCVATSGCQATGFILKLEKFFEQFQYMPQCEVDFK